MGMQLWKTQACHPFGDYTLIEFLEAHGAEIRDKQAMDVPVSAFKAALDNAKDLGLTKEEIEFIENEIKGADDEDIIDCYDLA
jgi:hypothetical protein